MNVIPSGVRIFLQVESRDRRLAISLARVLGILLRADPSRPVRLCSGLRQTSADRNGFRLPFGYAQCFGALALGLGSPLGRDDK
jgi:hypothetical protein